LSDEQQDQHPEEEQVEAVEVHDPRLLRATKIAADAIQVVIDILVEDDPVLAEKVAAWTADAGAGAEVPTS
jgi:hypothetical protein